MKSLKDHAINGAKKMGKKSDKALWVAKRASLLASAATVAALAGKYGSKLLVKILTKN